MPSHFRTVHVPLAGRELLPLGDREAGVQLDDRCSDGDYREIAKLVGGGGFGLRFFGRKNPMEDLEVLRFFPGLVKLDVDLPHLRTLAGLELLQASLQSLALTLRHAVSLDHLLGMKMLSRLYLDPVRQRLDEISGIKSLRSLTLRSVSMPSLGLLASLSNLEALDLQLGGTADLAGMPTAHLRYFEATQVRGLKDLNPLEGIESLEEITLRSLKHVSELPDLRTLPHLKRLTLWDMKGVHELSAVLEAPALEELLLVDMRHLEVESVALLRDHPTLRAARLGLGGGEGQTSAGGTGPASCG